MSIRVIHSLGGKSEPKAHCQFCGETAVLYPVLTEVGHRLLCEWCAIGEHIHRKDLGEPLITIGEVLSMSAKAQKGKAV